MAHLHTHSLAFFCNRLCHSAYQTKNDKTKNRTTYRNLLLSLSLFPPFLTAQRANTKKFFWRARLKQTKTKRKRWCHIRIGMGVHNLMRLIYENARHAVSDACVETYRHCRIAIDANIYVYKCMAQRPFYHGRHIVRMLRLARWLRRRDIEPIFVFDNQSATLGAKLTERFERRARKRRNLARHNDVLAAIDILHHLRKRCVHIERLAQHTFVDEQRKKDVADALLFVLEDAERAFLPRQIVQSCANCLCAGVPAHARVRNRQLVPLHALLRCTTLFASESDWIDIDIAQAKSAAERQKILSTFRSICQAAHLPACEALCNAFSAKKQSAPSAPPESSNNAFAQQNIFLERDVPMLAAAEKSECTRITFCALYFQSRAHIPSQLSSDIERCWERLLLSLRATRAARADCDSTPQPLPTVLPVIYCSAVSETDNAPLCGQNLGGEYSTCVAPHSAALVSEIDSALKVYCAQEHRRVHAITEPKVASQGQQRNVDSTETSATQTERSLRRIFATLTHNMRSTTDSQSAHESVSMPPNSADSSSDNASLLHHFGTISHAVAQNHDAKSHSTSANTPTKIATKNAKTESSESSLSAQHIGKRLVRHTSSTQEDQFSAVHEMKQKKEIKRLQAAVESQGGAWGADNNLLSALFRSALLENNSEPAAVRDKRRPLLHRTRQCTRKRTIVALQDVAQHSTSLEHALHRLAWLAVSLEAQTVRVHYDQVDQVKRALTLAGEIVIEAPHEAEEHCSRLCASGTAFAVMSDDTDVVPFGARRVLRKCRFAHNATGHSVFAQAIDCEALQSAWKMSRAQLVDLCILIGCDFCPALRDVSAQRVFRCFLQNQCSLERTLAALPPHCVAPLQSANAMVAIERARAIFLGSQSHIDTNATKAAKQTADRDELRRFLIENQCLHRAREFLPRQQSLRRAEDTLSASFDDAE